MSRAPKSPTPQARPEPAAPLAFMVVAGLFFCIVIVKLGIPVILNSAVYSPDGLGDAIFGYDNYTWPDQWGYLMMIPVFAVGLFAVRWRPLPAHGAWLLLLPFVWVGWQYVAGAFTISPAHTGPVLAHFTACAALFYLGFFGLRGVRNPWPLWVGFGLALCWVLHIAMTQHFGGLEGDRKATLEGKSIVPPGFLNSPAGIVKINSDRVFGSFMYPNALAAGILLLLPVTLVYLWQVAPKVQPPVRALFIAIFGGCALACLYWSGSKTALLFMVCLGVIALVRSPLPIFWQRVLVYGVLILGAAAFTVKYVDSAARGKRSMEARLVYWQCALQIFEHHPVVGTGPGTFGDSFRPIKPLHAEWAALTHDDYLEQACDSGLLACLAYVLLIPGALFCIYRYRLPKKTPYFSLHFSIWLGLLGLFLDSGMEFNLYYPALAWPAFFLLGWLFGLPEETI